MHTLLALLAVALACALARPPAITPGPPAQPEASPQKGIRKYPRDFLTEYVVPEVAVPRYLGNDEEARNQLPPWLDLIDQELYIIKQMEAIERNPYDPEYVRWNQNNMESPTRHLGNAPYQNDEQQMYPDQKAVSILESPFRNFLYQLNKDESNENTNNVYYVNYPKKKDNEKSDANEVKDKKDMFAITPLETAFYQNDNVQENAVTPKEEEEVVDNNADSTIEPRKTRQNPNLSKTKTLVSEHLDRLRTGFTREDSEGTAKPHHIHILETPQEDTSESIYGIALIAAIGAALAVTVIGLAFGWYTLSKKAKAAADVDYPAYGVTGPSVDSSGDKKLAQSAHMYHYQHQKQQIIAMERNGMDRNGSVSDPESEDENEEGDYTVYECPGFATTGDMEVKNPLFKEEGTPATPAKGDGEKTQPKE